MFTRSSFSLNIYTIYISSNIIKSVKVSIFLQIPVFLYLWNIILAYNNIANVSRIFHLFSIVHFSFLFADIFTNGLYVFCTSFYRTRCRNREKAPCFRDSFETQTIRCSLTNRLKPRQWNNPEKNEIVIFPSAWRGKRVAKKINR